MLKDRYPRLFSMLEQNYGTCAATVLLGMTPHSDAEDHNMLDMPCIIDSFTWYETQQGHDFWYEIYKDMEGINNMFELGA